MDQREKQIGKQMKKNLLSTLAKFKMDFGRETENPVFNMTDNYTTLRRKSIHKVLCWSSITL
jgi:hypothetical protein